MELRQLSAAYSEAVAAVRQMLADSHEMHTLLMHTHTYVVCLLMLLLPLCIFLYQIIVRLLCGLLLLLLL